MLHGKSVFVCITIQECNYCKQRLVGVALLAHVVEPGACTTIESPAERRR